MARGAARRRPRAFVTHLSSSPFPATGRVVLYLGSMLIIELLLPSSSRSSSSGCTCATHACLDPITNLTVRIRKPPRYPKGQHKLTYMYCSRLKATDTNVQTPTQIRTTANIISSPSFRG